MCGKNDLKQVGGVTVLAKDKATTSQRRFQVASAYFGPKRWPPIENAMIISYTYWKALAAKHSKQRKNVFCCRIDNKAWEKYCSAGKFIETSCAFKSGVGYEHILGIKIRRVDVDDGRQQFFVKDVTPEGATRNGQLGGFCVGDQITNIEACYKSKQGTWALKNRPKLQMSTMTQEVWAEGQGLSDRLLANMFTEGYKKYTPVNFILVSFERKYMVLCDQAAIDIERKVEEVANACFSLAENINADPLAIGTVFSHDIGHDHEIVNATETKTIGFNEILYSTIELTWDFPTHTSTGMLIKKAVRTGATLVSSDDGAADVEQDGVSFDKKPKAIPSLQPDDLLVKICVKGCPATQKVSSSTCSSLLHCRDINDCNAENYCPSILGDMQNFIKSKFANRSVGDDGISSWTVNTGSVDISFEKDGRLNTSSITCAELSTVEFGFPSSNKVRAYSCHPADVCVCAVRACIVCKRVYFLISW